jgi:hypothetical protein
MPYQFELNEVTPYTTHSDYRVEILLHDNSTKKRTVVFSRSLELESNGVSVEDEAEEAVLCEANNDLCSGGEVREASDKVFHVELMDNYRGDQLAGRTE